LDLEEILEVLSAMHSHGEESDVGLRARKKRLVRQKIADTATAMFLVHGFEKVTVARVATACDLSEQTVFNYFPTKESMVFDRSDPSSGALANALRTRPDVALADIVTEVLSAQSPRIGHADQDNARALQLSRMYVDMVTNSPTLTAAQFSGLTRLADEVSAALADRNGLQADDPEVGVAAMTVVGIAVGQQHSIYRHVRHVASFTSLSRAVRSDLSRAVQLARPTLSAYDAIRMEH
jgi:AcrR family transcriptional regulator